MKKIILIIALFTSFASFGQIHYSIAKYSIISTAIDPNDPNKLIVNERVATKIDGAKENKFLEWDNITISVDANLSAKQIAESLPQKTQEWIDEHYNNN